jgi:hypothetical protein
MDESTHPNGLVPIKLMKYALSLIPELLKLIVGFRSVK